MFGGKMPSLSTDFISITAGILFTAVSFIATIVSLFQIRNKDFTLFSFGIFGITFGLRRFIQIPTMRAMLGPPFTLPYFNELLTFAMVISISAFLLNIFGRGFYNSMLWTFHSTYAYAAVAIVYDFLIQNSVSNAPIYRPLVLVWGFVWIINILFSRKQRDIELTVMQVTFITTIFLVVIDQLIGVGVLPWKIQFEQPGFSILFFGLGFVAVHHFYISERKLHSIEQEIEIARKIQQSNLPATVNSPAGFNIAARYIPMTTIAGDFYDIQFKENEAIGILIADVSGHGVGAALIGSMLKVAFASQTENLENPVRMMAEINRILRGKIEDSFVTACYVLFDLNNRRMVYTNAGHPPPLLFRALKKEMHKLSLGGTVFGPFDNPEYTSETLEFDKGDRLILFTDGFIETKNKTGEFFGDKCLEEFLNSHLTDSADITADKLIEHLSSWSGKLNKNSYDDDLTLIIVDVV